MSLVLLVDDEPALLEALGELIGQLGYESLLAGSGAEALALAESRYPDLVLTDYMMPGMSGLDLIHALQDRPALANIPVIMMSAGQPRRVEELAWRFIPKPLDTARLEALIAEGLQLSRERAQVPREPKPRTPESALSLAPDELLNWVAHEIKSPLSGAMMAAHMIRRGLDAGEKPAPLRRRNEVVLRQLTRMSQLISSILDAARLQEGKLKLRIGLVDVARLLTRCEEAWKETYPDARILVRGGDEAVNVQCDEERVRQVLDNLISNAVKYGGQSPQGIEVSLECADQTVAIRVRDYGRGIPADELPHLFDRFHRIGSGGQGHGLGLYIASSLAQLHEGRLTAASDDGQGSTFTLTLPRRVGSRSSRVA